MTDQVDSRKNFGMASAQECQQGGFDLATMISKLNSTDDDAPPSLNRIARLGIVGISRRVLGDDHPLKRKIVASFLKCFDEQLDWSLDDIPDDYLEYHALLLEAAHGGVR